MCRYLFCSVIFPVVVYFCFFFFFFNDTAPTEIYPLPLHDALPILSGELQQALAAGPADRKLRVLVDLRTQLDLAKLDRKSTRLNSSHGYISYAVFCLKKKKKQKTHKYEERSIHVHAQCTRAQPQYY